jgi:hypothetical protein
LSPQYRGGLIGVFDLRYRLFCRYRAKSQVVEGNELASLPSSENFGRIQEGIRPEHKRNLWGLTKIDELKELTN